MLRSLTAVAENDAILTIERITDIAASLTRLQLLLESPEGAAHLVRGGSTSSSDNAVEAWIASVMKLLKKPKVGCSKQGLIHNTVL